MFQPLRLLVNLVPRIVEEIMEVALQQTMVTKNLQSSHPAGRSQTHAVVLFVFHKGGLLGSEFLQHSGYGSGTHAEMMSRSGPPELASCRSQSNARRGAFRISQRGAFGQRVFAAFRLRKRHARRDDERGRCWSPVPGPRRPAPAGLSEDRIR